MEMLGMRQAINSSPDKSAHLYCIYVAVGLASQWWVGTFGDPGSHRETFKPLYTNQDTLFF